MTTFFYDQFLPATDLEGEASGGLKRQLDIFRPSGEDYIEIRLGELGEEHQGRGYSIRIERKDAADLLDGVERALSYHGWLAR